ncbi:MAG: hypothetical protein QG669_347, partial [Patescibacteria group bacterium]|nr:hypothetical protein [Patescibacteria group bacterium]
QNVLAKARSMIEKGVFEDTFEDGMLIQVSTELSKLNVKSRIYNTVVNESFVVVGSKN